MKPTVTRCPTCKRKRTRTSNANRYYWLLLYAIADKVQPEGKHYAAESYHLYFKSKYLGCNDVQMPNGKTMAVPRTTTELDTSEFAEYVQRVETWAAKRDVFVEALESEQG